jgi:hypothetical protein
VPELRQYREVYAEFADKKLADRYYFDLVRGADFYLPLTDQRQFETKPKQSPTPW